MVCIVPFDNEFPRPGPPEEMMVRMVPFDNEFPRPGPPEVMMVCMVPFDNEFPRPRPPGGNDGVNCTIYQHIVPVRASRGA